NEVKQADEQHKEGEAAHGEAQKAHDADKDKPEEQAKQFVDNLKGQYSKLHEQVMQLPGPAGEAAKNANTAIQKCTGAFMAQARGAMDLIQAAMETAKAHAEEAKKGRG